MKEHTCVGPKGRVDERKRSRKRKGVVGIIRTALPKIQCIRVKCVKGGGMNVTRIAVPSPLHREGTS